MSILDWCFVLFPVIACLCIAVYTHRYVRSVADYLAGGRNAGRFLLCAAKSEMGAGSIMLIAGCEVFFQSGFVITWWGQIAAPIGLIVAISGFVVYRYRQTRALTLSQFFEMRYNKNFRLFTGFLGFFAGLVNFGIIPVIGARFVTYFMGLPYAIDLFGITVPTYLLIMFCSLTICTTLIILGGQITILATDCAGGMLSQIFYVVIGTVLLLQFSDWSHTRAILVDRPSGHSMVNPFDAFSVSDFNLWFVLMNIACWIYTTMAWQNTQAFNASAATPHESRMGGVLGNWRGFAVNVMITVLAVCAVVYLSDAQHKAHVDSLLQAIPDGHTRQQMLGPVALSQMLPVGLKGMLCAIVIIGIFGSDGMHIHSWSSIFVQDILMVLRKKPFSTKQHLFLLRLSVVGVALWAFFFGALFPQTEFLAMWFGVTEAIYTGGAGAAIIGGLYWSRGTAQGAWSGLITGSSLSVGGIILRQIYPAFPFNGRVIAFFACVAAIVVYVVVSLLTCKQPHDMDKLLHRGKYAVAEDKDKISTRRMGLLTRIIGIDDNFTRGDRWIAGGIFFWSIAWFVIFAVGTLWYLCWPWSDNAWADYWLVTAILLPLFIGVVTTIWFTWGCWKDMKVFFRRLKTERIDESDDGTVRDK